MRGRGVFSETVILSGAKNLAWDAGFFAAPSAPLRILSVSVCVGLRLIILPQTHTDEHRLKDRINSDNIFNVLSVSVWVGLRLIILPQTHTDVHRQKD